MPLYKAVIKKYDVIYVSAPSIKSAKEYMSSGKDWKADYPEYCFDSIRKVERAFEVDSEWATIDEEKEILCYGPNNADETIYQALYNVSLSIPLECSDDEADALCDKFLKSLERAKKKFISERERKYK